MVNQCILELCKDFRLSSINRLLIIVCALYYPFGFFSSKYFDDF